MENYYIILGVDETASQEEIKKAYRDLAKRWHPDRNSGSHHYADIFKRINEAYAVLSNENTRADYNRRLFNYRLNLNFQAENNGSGVTDRAIFYETSKENKEHPLTLRERLKANIEKLIFEEYWEDESKPDIGINPKREYHKKQGQEILRRVYKKLVNAIFEDVDN